MIKLEDIIIRTNKGKVILENINLFFPTGSVIWVDGRPGSGKTSLINLLGLVTPPMAGSYSFMGKNLKKLHRNEILQCHKEISIVFEKRKFIENFSVKENIIFPMIMNNDRIEEIEYALKELVPWLNLDNIIDESICSLSSSEIKTVQFARAIIARPRLLLIDNFFSNIESSLEKKMIYLTLALNKIGTTVVIVGKSPENSLIRYDLKYNITNKTINEVRNSS